MKFLSNTTQNLLLLICLYAPMTAWASINVQELKNVISKAKENAWSIVKDDHWCLPPFLGTLFLSEYYFELHALNWTAESKFNQTFFTNHLFGTQLADGSWKQVLESNLESGDLDATVFNYWYLKSANPGIQKKDERMIKSQNWIISKGGIEALQTMSKFKLAAYGLYRWEDLWYIPLFIFNKDSWFYAQNIVAQWVYPHLTALAYLRYHKTVFRHGAADLKELWIDYKEIHIDHEQAARSRSRSSPLDESVLNLVREMIELKRPLGSFGAYTISTLLSLLALEDFSNRYIPEQIPLQVSREIFSANRKGFWYVEFNYFNELVPYEGSLDDGRWWDTILISWALLQAGEKPSLLKKTVEVMLKNGVQQSGGIAYGLDFEYAPDADDTGLLLLVLGFFDNFEFSDSIELSDRWLHTMQNTDGGFPAFDQGKTGDSWLLQLPFKVAGITNSAEIFDPSSVDVTSHILEGFGSLGYTYKNDPVIKQAIEYIKDNQLPWGSWEARWGINQIYAVGCIIPALKRVGYKITEPWVLKSLHWLVSQQNADGGFGETTLSYNYPEKYAGVGNSTVTQTAWALLALVEVLDEFDFVKEPAERAVNYLINDFRSAGDKFFDSSVIGTGHRGVLYLQYPAYAYSFPLVAIARYQQQIETKFEAQRESLKQQHRTRKSDL